MPTAAVHAYDIRTDTWSPRASHPLAVLRHAVCAHRGDAYVAGGYVPRDGDGPELQVSGALHMYSSATDTWAPRAPMLEPRAEASLVLQGDRLYLVGGGVLYGERLAVSGVESYDTGQLFLFEPFVLLVERALVGKAGECACFSLCLKDCLQKSGSSLVAGSWTLSSERQIIPLFGRLNCHSLPVGGRKHVARRIQCDHF